MWYWIFRSLFIITLKIFFRFKVEGRENLPAKTNFIAVANHASFMDALVVGAAIPQRTYWIAFRGLFKIFWLRWFLNSIGAIPSGNAAAKTIELLRQKKNVGLFPEGRVTHDGKLGEFRSGVALLALKTGRPLVPCAINGTFQALPRSARFPKFFVPITVKIGKPRYLLREFTDTVDEVYLQEGMLKIKNNIKEMLHGG
jgi:1-acyl-sn-glycerol-3-phosphate acyltransferase